MVRGWTGTGTEVGESLDESFENVSAPSSFLPQIALPPRPQKPPPHGEPALAAATKQQSPLPPPPSAHLPKLPLRPVSQPRSSVVCFASQGYPPSPFSSGVNSPVLIRTSSASSSPPSLKHTRRASSTAHPTLRRCHRHLAPIPTATAIAPSLSTHLRPVGHNESQTVLPSFHKSQRPLAHRHPPLVSLSATATSTPNIAESETTGVNSSARPVQPALRRKLARACTEDADACARPVHRHRHDRGIIPASPQTEPGPEPGPDARLDGRVVRAIWFKSSQPIMPYHSLLYVTPPMQDRTSLPTPSPSHPQHRSPASPHSPLADVALPHRA